MIKGLLLSSFLIFLGIKVETKGTMDSVGVQTVDQFYKPLMELGIGAGVYLLTRLYKPRIDRVVTLVDASVGTSENALVDASVSTSENNPLVTSVVIPRLFSALHVLNSRGFLDYPLLMSLRSVNVEQRNAVDYTYLGPKRESYRKLLTSNRLTNSILEVVKTFELAKRHDYTRNPEPLEGDSKGLSETLRLFFIMLAQVENQMYRGRLYSAESRKDMQILFGTEDPRDIERKIRDMAVHPFGVCLRPFGVNEKRKVSIQFLRFTPGIEGPIGTPIQSEMQFDMEITDSADLKIGGGSFKIFDLEKNTHPSLDLRSHQDCDLKLSKADPKRSTLQQEARYKKLRNQSSKFIQMSMDRFLSTTVFNHWRIHKNLCDFIKWNQQVVAFLITSNNIDHKVELMMQVEKLKAQGKYRACCNFKPRGLDELAIIQIGLRKPIADHDRYRSSVPFIPTKILGDFSPLSEVVEQIHKNPSLGLNLQEVPEQKVSGVKAIKLYERLIKLYGVTPEFALFNSIEIL